MFLKYFSSGNINESAAFVFTISSDVCVAVAVFSFEFSLHEKRVVIF